MLTHSGRAAPMRLPQVRVLILEENASASKPLRFEGPAGKHWAAIVETQVTLKGLCWSVILVQSPAAATDNASRQNLVDAASIEIDNLELPTKRIKSFTDAW